MKEYIYLDNELVNSYLAQLDEGILTKMITGSSTVDNYQEDGGEEITNITNGGFNIHVTSGGRSYSKKEIDKYSTVYSKNNSELIETALNDYSLDILLDKLYQRNLLQDINNNSEDGEIILSSGKLNVFNFSQIQKSTVPEVLANIHPEDLEITRLKNELDTLMKNNQSIIKHSERIIEVRDELQKNDSFGNLNKMSEFLNILFPETTLFKIENLLIMCANENMRTNIPTLSLYSYTNRKFKVLGVIISNNKKTLAPNGKDIWAPIKIASESPAAFMEIMLTSFEISDNNNYFIKPIAIYYEKE